MKKTRMIVLAVSVLLLAVLVLPFMAALAEPAPDKIRFGASMQLSGWGAKGADSSQITEYKLWMEQTNAKGGLYVKKYGKRIPVELILYDNKSDMETTVKMFEKLILEEKVHFMLPPWGTAFNFAVAPVANRYGYILIASMCHALHVKEVTAKVPYFFTILNQPPAQAAGLVEVLQDVGVKSVAIVYIADLMGVENSGVAAPLIGKTDIEIAMLKSYPLNPTDLSPLIKKFKALNVDGVVAYSYPTSSFLFTKQMIALDYNPKLLFLGVGQHWPHYRDSFGSDTVEGIMGLGAWNPKVNAPGARKFFDDYVKRWGKEPPRWGEASSYASLEILEEAIEIAGSLDQAKLREIIATKTFSTIIGPVKFVDGVNIYYPGQTGQWQKGEYEIIAPKANRTADPIYPKPKWPRKK